MAFLVERYLNQKNLAKLGYTTPTSCISDLEVQAFAVLSSEFAKLEEKALEKQARQKA